MVQSGASTVTRSATSRMLRVTPQALRLVSSYAYYEALVDSEKSRARGQRDQAQDFYERAVARNPYQVIAFHNLASLFLGSDAVKLRSVVERGLLFNPHDPELVQLHNN